METLSSDEQRILRDTFEMQSVDLERMSGYYHFEDNSTYILLNGSFSQKELLAFAIAMKVMAQYNEFNNK